MGRGAKECVPGRAGHARGSDGRSVVFGVLFHGLMFHVVMVHLFGLRHVRHIGLGRGHHALNGVFQCLGGIGNAFGQVSDDIGQIHHQSPLNAAGLRCRGPSQQNVVARRFDDGFVTYPHLGESLPGLGCWRGLRA